MFEIWVTDERVKEGPPKRYLEATAVDEDHLDFLLGELHFRLTVSGGDIWGTPYAQAIHKMWEIEVIEVAP